MQNTFTSMMSKSEQSRITAFAQNVMGAQCVVEIGCWVGESTKAILRGFSGELHLIDKFIWTSDHHEKYPDIAAVGEDFSAITRENLSDFDRTGEIHLHKISAEEFNPALLGDTPVGLLILDGPKDPRLVQHLILQFVPHMAQTGRILVKHAASSRFTDLVDVMVRLIDAEILTPVAEFPAEGADTMLAFGPGQVTTVPDELLSSTWLDVFDKHLKPALERCPVGQLLPVIWLLRAKHKDAAFQCARKLSYSPSLLNAWVDLQDFLLNREGMDLEVLIELEMHLTA